MTMTEKHNDEIERLQQRIAELEMEQEAGDMNSQAYWRGQDAGVAGVSGRWREALENAIPKLGTLGDKQLEALYRSTEKLRLRIAELEATIAGLNGRIDGYKQALSEAAEPKDCEDCLRLCDERDGAEAYADQLAAMIGVITGIDVGEHSNLNCPWDEAIEAATDFIAKKQASPQTVDQRTPQ